MAAVRHTGLPAGLPDRITVLDCSLKAHVQAGIPDPRNGRSVVQTLDIALETVRDGWCDAMVTAPVQKSVINDAGVPFSGHTEYLAEKTHTDRVVMMLACEANAHLPYPLRVALATTHLPLRAVPDAITETLLMEVLRIIDADLRTNGVSLHRKFWSAD
jgi:4-hydroxythreonine-4-phosphate dehydrogenase